MSSFLVKAACVVGAVVVGSAVSQPNAMAQSPAATQCQQTYQLACLGADQLEHAYGLSALYAKGITGAGTTIAIVDPYGSPTIASDLSVFDAEFGLPAPPSLTVIQPQGQLPAYDASTMSAWASEATLDVEYAHAMAPGARILLAETPDTSSEVAEGYILSHYHVDVISQSFSMTEQTLPKATLDAMHAVYQRAQARHVTVVASSGDTGAANTGLDDVTYFSSPATQYPASDPLVTTVGGTELRLDGDGDREAADTVWNDTYDGGVNETDYRDAGPNPMASGGGKSVLFARPSYQDSVRGAVGDSRGVPDVSMSAACSAPVVTYQSFGGQAAGWYPACGTSEAAPLFAGVVALADQEAGHSLGLINPALYQLAAGHAAGIVPVTSGNNTVTFTQDGREQTIQGYSATSGYSLAAGVGTVDAQYFVPELAHAATQLATPAAPHPASPATPVIPPATLALTSHSHRPM